jgi:hypothetical protein
VSARSTFGRRLTLAAAVAALANGVVAGPAVLAHGPNPILGTGTRWDKDQIVGYQWDPAGVPPAWAAAEIDAAAEDVGQSRASRAATFKRVSDADSRIYYGFNVPCSSYGIACMNRTGVPDSFAGMWFRPHLWTLDWGTLKWCQAMATVANGCYDVENVALDEFGHIELLGHHVNYADESDFTDSVVQFAARSRAKEGWNQHVFGRCDVARLQLEYELRASGDPVSSCLNLATTLTISGPSSVSTGGLVRISGSLRIASASSARELSGDPLSYRTVTLQKRVLGATSWTAVGALSSNLAAGSYGLTITVNQTADYRLQYDSPSTEGLQNSVSAALRITATTSSCTSIATSGTTSRALKGPQYIVPPPDC